MVRFLENADLRHYNTFNLKASCDYLFDFTESDDLQVFLESNQVPEKRFILGGGSNVLFMEHFQGIVIQPNIPGIYEVGEDRNHVYVEAGAGEEWDNLVRYTVQYGLGGLENLSSIPGKVGASPVQNIGAYGVEAKDCIDLVKGILIENNQRAEFTNEECQFGYRDSIFKNELKGKVVITSVRFKLDKFPEFKLGYGDVKREVEMLGEVNLGNIRKAIIGIREAKLPDPKVIGNAGSFFKNPVVDESLALQLKAGFPTIPVYASGIEGKQKLAAGWLIEQCGWKGFRRGDVGVHPKQSLVLVNYGGAGGSDVLSLSEEIIFSVKKRFNIELEREVNVV